MALPISGTINDNQAGILRPRKTATPLIINGDMQIAQRGTSVTGITSGTNYLLDRFAYAVSTAGTWTQSQSTDVPSGQGFSNSAKLDCTTDNASLSASSFAYFQQRFEGQNLQMLKKGTSNAESVTLSFWVKSAKTGTYIIELFDGDNNRSISQAYTISSANTWEKKVLSFEGDTTGVFDNDNVLSLYLFFWLVAGTNYTSGTLNTSWGAYTNADRAVGQVNLADSTSNDWYITGVQLEVGTFDANSIPDFQFEDVGTSLMRCMRYTQCFGGNNNKETFCSGGCNTTTIQTMLIEHKTEMRTTPSVSVSALNDFQVVVPSGFTTATTSITLATDNSGTTASTITTNTTSQAASQVGRYCNLRCVDVTNGKLTLSAEL